MDRWLSIDGVVRQSRSNVYLRVRCSDHACTLAGISRYSRAECIHRAKGSRVAPQLIKIVGHERWAARRESAWASWRMCTWVREGAFLVAWRAHSESDVARVKYLVRAKVEVRGEGEGEG